MIRILVEEVSDLSLLGIQTVLDEDHRFSVVATARGLTELLEHAPHAQPDIILYGEGLYGVAIMDVIEQMQQAIPSARLLMMGSLMDGRFFQNLFHAGVRGYLYRGDDLCSVLPHAILTVMREKLYLSPTASSEYLVTMQSPHHDRTLDWEARMVLRLLANGLHINAIAAQMNVPLRRVYWVREKLRKRFGANTNEHLISMAIAEGFTNADT